MTRMRGPPRYRRSPTRCAPRNLLATTGWVTRGRSWIAPDPLLDGSAALALTLESMEHRSTDARQLVDTNNRQARVTGNRVELADCLELGIGFRERLCSPARRRPELALERSTVAM